mgnify:CR=1 FL=1
MSDCDHSFSGDDICNSCGYSIGYLLINAEQEIAALKAELAMAREALLSIAGGDIDYPEQCARRALKKEAVQCTQSNN